MSGTTRVSQHQKVHLATFWIFCCKMKIIQADAPTIRMDCHPIQTNWCHHLCHHYHFYAGCLSLHNPPNLSWLGSGTKFAGLHTQWLGLWYYCTWTEDKLRQKTNYLPELIAGTAIECTLMLLLAYMKQFLKADLSIWWHSSLSWKRLELGPATWIT